jgi:prephenate dehydratase
MASYTYDELHKKTVAELREIAKGIEHEAVQGHTQMNKEHLVPAICQALGIEAHAHHHISDGFDKNAIKTRMRKLKGERTAAIAAHDAARLHALRRELHALNHRIRAHIV